MRLVILISAILAGCATKGKSAMELLEIKPAPIAECRATQPYPSLFTRALPSVSDVKKSRVYDRDSLEDALLDLENDYGVRFLKGASSLGIKISASYQNADFASALKTVLYAAGYDFRYLKQQNVFYVAPSSTDDPVLSQRLVYRPRHLIPSVIHASLPDRYRKTAVANNNAGTVTIEAPGQMIEDISEIISQLDQEREQVLLNLSIVEVDRSRMREMGRELGDRSVLGLADSFSPLAPAMQASVMTADAYRAFMGTLLAMETERFAEVKAEPKLLAQDARKASYESVKRAKIETTGFRSIKDMYVEAPTKLEITPYLEGDDRVRLEISQASHAEVTADAGQITQSSVTTQAVVRMGETVVIGGMINSRTEKRVEGWPLISEIPYLGSLFRYQKQDTREVETIFTIRPERACSQLKNQSDNEVKAAKDQSDSTPEETNPPSAQKRSAKMHAGKKQKDP